MRTITIDRRGDVVCVAREQLDTDAEFGFLVNSKVLAHGSDFFVALIEGKFEEGIRLANTLSSPVRIDLLGDDVVRVVLRAECALCRLTGTTGRTQTFLPSLAPLP